MQRYRDGAGIIKAGKNIEKEEQRMLSRVRIDRPCADCGVVSGRKRQTWTKCQQLFGRQLCCLCEMAARDKQKKTDAAVTA